MNGRTSVVLWAAQRISAMVLAIFVVVHLATMIYAVNAGLTAEAILDRTQGSLGWGVFYSLFVLAAAVHAPVGLRVILAESLGWRGRKVDFLLSLFGLVLAILGWRAVAGVVL